MRFPPTLPVQVGFTPDGRCVYVSLTDEQPQSGRLM